MLFWTLVLTLALAANAYIVEPGPVVKATKGEVWPKPQHQLKVDGFLDLQPQSFQFKAVGSQCALLEKAFARYTDIISNMVTTAIIERDLYWTGIRGEIHANSSYRGSIEKLDVNLKGECNGSAIPSVYMQEKYSLNITSANQTLLESESIWGIMRGLETFTQMLVIDEDYKTLILNLTEIEDFPRFAHRGLLLDTSRHYIPMRYIYQTINAMSFNKLNVFHWHIVDDHSFPYQSKAFPDLSAKGAYHPSKVYTPDDVQKVIIYAAERGIRVLPEFDTPGHTRSWGVAYPELLTECYDKTGNKTGQLGPIDPTNEFVYSFVYELLTEVQNTFPDTYLHLGGDEVGFECWSSNPNILAFMEANNMNNFTQLEEYYIQRIVDVAEGLNVTPIFWEEVFTNGVDITNETIIHVWKVASGEEVLSQVTETGLQALYSACWYLDHLANGGDWQKYYNCDPINFNMTESQLSLVLGGEACMWSEAVDANNIMSRVWPRASAVAERLWSSPNATDIDDAKRRLEEHTCRMIARGIPAQPPNGPGICL